MSDEGDRPVSARPAMVGAFGGCDQAEKVEALRRRREKLERQRLGPPSRAFSSALRGSGDESEGQFEPGEVDPGEGIENQNRGGRAVPQTDGSKPESRSPALPNSASASRMQRGLSRHGVLNRVIIKG